MFFIRSGILLLCSLMPVVLSAEVPPLDIHNRDDVSNAYLKYFCPADHVAPQSTQNYSGRYPGTTSIDFQKAVENRINFYRVMAGLPGDVKLNTTMSAEAQNVAFMIGANSDLWYGASISSYFRIFRDPMYSMNEKELSDGYTLSHKWRLFEPNYRQLMIDGITGYGRNSATAAYFAVKNQSINLTGFPEYVTSSKSSVFPYERNKILSPFLTEMGVGTIEHQQVIDSGDRSPRRFGSGAASAITFKYDTGKPAQFFSWPPAGQVPYTLIPVNWSVTLPGADFSNAKVTVTIGLPGDQTEATHTVIRASEMGTAENPYGLIQDTFSWKLTEFTGNVSFFDQNKYVANPREEQLYQVKIENVLVNGTPQVIAYNVHQFDPHPDIYATRVDVQFAPLVEDSNDQFIRLRLFTGEGGCLVRRPVPNPLQRSDWERRQPDGTYLDREPRYGYFQAMYSPDGIQEFKPVLAQSHLGIPTSKYQFETDFHSRSFKDGFYKFIHRTSYVKDGGYVYEDYASSEVLQYAEGFGFRAPGGQFSLPTKLFDIDSIKLPEKEGSQQTDVVDSPDDTQNPLILQAKKKCKRRARRQCKSKKNKRRCKRIKRNRCLARIGL